MSTVVYETKVGPIRARIEAEGSALALFDAKVRNTIIRTALSAGGQFWLQVFLPKRFSSYATTFGYTASQRWRKFKEFELGAAVPFVGFTPPGGGPAAPRWKQKNGEKMITAALNGANYTATATAANARIIFRIPYGHPVQQMTSDMFRTVPSWEVERVGEVVGKKLQDILDGLLPAGAVPPITPRVVGSAPSVRISGAGERRVSGSRQRKVA